MNDEKMWIEQVEKAYHTAMYETTKRFFDQNMTSGSIDPNAEQNFQRATVKLEWLHHTLLKVIGGAKEKNNS